MSTIKLEDLKEDQLKVVDAIYDFATGNSGVMEMLVEGPAGTGKTSAIRASVGQLPEETAQRVVVCAPTNKAVKVARELSGGVLRTSTIYKLLSLSPQANGEVKEIRQGGEWEGRLQDVELVLLDEASMNNQTLRTYIRQAQADFGIKFVMIGDRYQLPPVGEDISWVFKEIPNRIALTEVKRHDNAILNLATHIRHVLDSGGEGLQIAESFDEELGGVRTFSRMKAFDELITDTWRDAAEAGNELSSHRILAWRNDRVRGHNDVVRETLYGRREARDNPLMVGERIVVTNPCVSLQDDNQVLMYTDEEGIIKSMKVTQHPKYNEVECFALVIHRESDGKPVGIYTPTPDGWRVVTRMLNQFKSKAMRDKVFWGAFWKLKEMMNDVRPCHALTTHRSQGSTFRETFVDVDDILANRNKIEALKSLYVAITRASHTANIKWGGR